MGTLTKVFLVFQVDFRQTLPNQSKPKSGFFRREAAQVHRVFEVFLAEQQLDHTHAQAHGLQAVRVRAL